VGAWPQRGRRWSGRTGGGARCDAARARHAGRRDSLDGSAVSRSSAGPCHLRASGARYVQHTVLTAPLRSARIRGWFDTDQGVLHWSRKVASHTRGPALLGVRTAKSREANRLVSEEFKQRRVHKYVPHSEQESREAHRSRATRRDVLRGAAGGACAGTTWRCRSISRRRRWARSRAT
jgi:hypothetical protein